VVAGNFATEPNAAPPGQVSEQHRRGRPRQAQAADSAGADLCANQPERVARRLVDLGFAPHYDDALQTLNDVPYDRWREYDSEDTIRYYALRLHELGIIKSTPQKIIAENTNWHFFNELKRELKA
jgi:hypothetical protein